MKNFSKIALGTALGTALMFATKPGPSIAAWNEFHGMGVLSCDLAGGATIKNSSIVYSGRPIDVSGMCQTPGASAVLMHLD